MVDEYGEGGIKSKFLGLAISREAKKDTRKDEVMTWEVV